MKKILLYCICVLWAVILFANVLRFFGNESMVAALSSVPEMPINMQKAAKAFMFFLEMTFGLALVTRGCTLKVCVIAATATTLSGFVASPMENIYLCSVAYLVAIILWTKEPRKAMEEAVILVLLYTLYGVLTQLGRFTFDLANYKNCTVQILSCVDYKMLPLLGFLYSKYYGKEERLCLHSLVAGIPLVARSCSVTKILRCRTSADADSSK